jgi:HAD superfamily 5'-nucleotidase-like hydrolase
MTDLRTWGRIHHESRLPPEHRIYVNRNLRLGSVQAIGFDLDHTLAHYRGPAVEELAYRLARRYLVKRFGYPEALLEVPYDRGFVIRGLVIDKRRGNILKMNYHNYVARGSHGLRMLEPEERKATYRSGRIRMGNPSYVTVDTLFHLPEVYLFMVLVHLLEQESGRRRTARQYEKIFTDVRFSVDSVHADGSLKQEILGNLDKYIRKDPRLAPTLRELARAGKKLFLLTNSEYYYTDALLNYLLANGGNRTLSDWRELFHLIMVEAHKPVFFTSTEGEPTAHEETDAPCPIFSGGHARFLENALGFRGDEILYFGDHTYGDILRSKKSLGWRTAMVVEELREEIETTRRLQPQLDELSHWKALRSVLEADLSAMEVEQRKLERRMEKRNGRGEAISKIKKRMEALGDEETRIGQELDKVKQVTGEMGDALNESYNSRWGPLFREGQEMSHFAHQVKDFACIYMTRVSNLLYYDLNHYFRSATEWMPHEL